MRKFQKAFNVIAALRAATRGSQYTNEIKRVIGDSTKNNRTLTVNQLVRYLTKMGNVNTARLVQTTNCVLSEQIIRLRSKNRTDAVDLSELVNTYRTVVMNGRSDTYRRRIGNALAKVG